MIKVQNTTIERMNDIEHAEDYLDIDRDRQFKNIVTEQLGENGITLIVNLSLLFVLFLVLLLILTFLTFIMNDKRLNLNLKKMELKNNSIKLLPK